MAKRRANGAGSIRKRADGTWEARYSTPDGRQRSLYAKTRQEANAKLKKRNAELALGIWFEPSSVTVKAWAKTWLEQYCKHLKPTTLTTYTRHVDNHIIPTLGTIKLSRLKAINIQQMFNGLTLSPSTQTTVKIVLSSMLESAKRYGLINSNPCADVIIPKQQRHAMVIIDRKDLPEFVRRAKEHRYGVAMILLLQTGLRTSELRGLRWSDFNEQEKRLTVSRQIIYVNNKPAIQSPKDNEVRGIALMDETIAMLKQHRIQQAELRLQHGGWTDTDITADLIFRKPNGSCYSHSALYDAVRKIGHEMGIEGLHPHSLRDSYAVSALRSGIEVKTIQNNLGHSDASMTLNNYAAYTNDMGAESAEKLSKYWSKNNI